MKPDYYAKFETIFFSVIIFGFVGYAFAAVWTQDVPKSYPARSQYLLSKAEETMRNCDPNSFEFMVAKQAAAKLNKYLAVAGQQKGGCDVNLDGVVDQNDIALVTKALGVDGRGIRMEELK